MGHVSSNPNQHTSQIAFDDAGLRAFNMTNGHFK
jgi:hypothetical protein